MKRMLLGFAVGVLLANIWPLPSLVLSPVILILSVFTRPRTLDLSFSFLAGCVWVALHWSQAYSQAIPQEQGRQQWQLLGEVGRVSQQLGRSEFDFYPRGPFNKLKVSCYQCPWPIERGDEWALALKLKPFVSFHNPTGFDYRQWMLAKGYAAQASVVVKHGYNQRIQHAGDSLARDISKRLAATSFPVLRALLLGDKQGMSAQYKRLINGSGLGHLFVVSGLHVGIVAMIFAMLLAWLQRPLLLLFWPYGPALALCGGLAMAFFYAYLSGLNVPALRACIMLLFAALWVLQGRHGQMIHYLLLAFTLVALINPLAFSGVGSWLSFAIVAALIVGMSISRHKSGFAQLWSAQCLAFLAGAVILVGYAMPLAPLGLLLNLLFIPLITLLVLPAALLALSLALLGSGESLLMLEQALHYLFDFLLGHQHILTYGPSIHDGNRYLVMAGICILLLPRVLAARQLAWGCLLVALWLPIERPREGGFSLVVLDVGQGSAALIETAGHVILVDTGTRFSSGMTLVDYVIWPYMRSRNIRQLDMLHISHDDKDHSGGASLLAPNSAAVIDQHHCDNVSWQWDGVRFERFKAPGFQQGNNGSCLLRVEDRAGHSLLLTGDIEVQAERALLASMADKLAADVLLVAHHGSRTSSSEAFLNQVKPTVAIISSGALSHYGHPHGEVVQRLHSRLIEVYTTASHGALQVDFEPRQERLSVSTYRPKL